MAELKASEVKYGAPIVTKISDLLFTITNIELPASAEYAEGGIELNLAKLGLTDEAVAGLSPVSRESAVGETASTTSLAAGIWSDPFLVKAKESGEEKKQVAEAVPCAVTVVKAKAFLRVLTTETAGIGKPFIEPKTSTKVNIGLFQTTIYAFGK
jgi:hypothetical protein